MWKRCEAKDRMGRTLTLKLRFSDFSTITRSITQPQGFTYEEMLSCMMNLLPEQEIKERGVRLLGGTMSNFNIENQKSTDQMKINFELDIS